MTRTIGELGERESVAGLWARAAHDLRQPLQAALLLASVLGDVSERAELKCTARGIGSALRALDEMLEVLILLARIEAGLQNVELRTCQLDDVLEPAALRELAEIAATRGISLRLRRLQGAVRSNPKLLATAARSLLLNAIRFAAGGDVLVSCRRVRDQVKLEIRFSGASLATRAEKHAFIQLAPKGGGPIAGEFGLGLSLLRPLCCSLRHGLQYTDLGPERQLLALMLAVPGGAAAELR